MAEWAPLFPWHAKHSDLEWIEDGIPLGQFDPKLNYDHGCRADPLTSDHVFIVVIKIVKSLFIYLNEKCIFCFLKHFTSYLNRLRSEATPGPKNHFCPIKRVRKVLRVCFPFSRPDRWSALTHAGGSSFSPGSASASGAQGRCRSRRPTHNFLPLVPTLKHLKRGFQIAYRLHNFVCMCSRLLAMSL